MLVRNCGGVATNERACNQNSETERIILYLCTFCCKLLPCCTALGKLCLCACVRPLTGTLALQVIFEDEVGESRLLAARARMQQKYLAQFDDLYEDFHLVRCSTKLMLAPPVAVHLPCYCSPEQRRM